MCFPQTQVKTATILANRAQKSSIWLEKLVETSSSLQRLIRKITYFFHWWGRVSRFNTKLDIEGPILAAEYKDAFHYLVYLDQKLHFSEAQNKHLVAKKVSVQLTGIKMLVD